VVIVDRLGRPYVAGSMAVDSLTGFNGFVMRYVETPSGVAELSVRQEPRCSPPAFLRGSLSVPEGASAALLDISGRVVMSLQPGPNDIRHVAPGVYFVREEGSRSEPSDGTCEDAEQGSEVPSVRKVVVQK
jgi:hypothetical protein